MNWLELMTGIFDRAKALDSMISILQSSIISTKIKYRNELNNSVKLFKQTQKSNLKKLEKAEIAKLREQIHLKKLEKKDLNRKLDINLIDIVTSKNEPGFTPKTITADDDSGYGAVSWKKF